jgi:hypothetical protein
MAKSPRASARRRFRAELSGPLRCLPWIPTAPIDTREEKLARGMTYSDAPREPPSYHCGNGCSFYVFETGEQIERCSYFFIVS